MTHRPVAPRTLRTPAPVRGRHIGPAHDDVAKMLAVVGYGSLDELTAAAVPAAIRRSRAWPCRPAAPRPRCWPSCARWPPATTVLHLDDRPGLLRHRSRPAVILRNVLENPAWYTAYTPYQPEISPGPARGAAQLPDHGRRPDRPADRRTPRCSTRRTAAAEAMTLMRRAAQVGKADRSCVDADCLPQTIAVVRTRAEPLGIEVRRRRPDADGPARRRRSSACCCSTRARPARSATCAPLVAAAHERGALVVGRRRPAGADAAARRRASSAPTSPSAPPSASACRWASAARTPATWRSAPGCERSAARPAGRRLASTPTATRPTGSRCRPASSTSAGRRRPATSAPRRCCSP